MQVEIDSKHIPLERKSDITETSYLNGKNKLSNLS